jgi:hypothetical protein
MKAIARFFLCARHWQIFLIVSGMFFGGLIILMATISPTVNPNEIVTKQGLVSGFMMAVAMSGYLLWLWSMGSFFNSLVAPELRLKSRFLRFALIYPPVYMFSLSGQLLTFVRNCLC